MSELDLLKEKIGLLKLWLGIFVVTEVSLLRISSILAIIGLLVVILAFNRRMKRLLDSYGIYNMDIIVSVVFLTFIGVLIYCGIDILRWTK